MRHSQGGLVALALVTALMAAGSTPARANGIRVVEQTERGLVLRIDVTDPVQRSSPAGQRVRLALSGALVTSEPGRPELPFFAAQVAIPPGARVRARVLEAGEETVEDVRVAIARRPVMREDRDRFGFVPGYEEVAPVADGSWPRSPVEVGDAFTIRRQWVVTVQAFPFRYDESSGQLWTRGSFTVALEFTGVTASRMAPLGAEDDRQWEPVLQSTLLNYEQGRSWRERRRPDTGSLFERADVRDRARLEGAPEFDEDEPEVRVRIDTTGVHAIEFDQLALHGYPSGVPISAVTVHRHEYIQDPPAAGPAYVTIELPIEVDDRDLDGVFGPGDRILAWVRNWLDRARPSPIQRSWGDGEVVFVSRLTGRPGLRLPQRSGWLGQSLTPRASFPWMQHFERNTGFLPVFQPFVNDTGRTEPWVWIAPGASLVQLYAVPDSFRFEVHDIDTTFLARVAVNWQGTKANNHLVWAHVRNGASRITTVVDSSLWGGRDTLTRRGTLFGSALTNGANVLRTWGRTQPCTGFDCQRVFAVMNFFEVSYWRRYNAIGEYLSCNSGGVNGDFEIRASGFGFRDVRVYDVTDSLNPVRLAIHDSLITGAYPHAVRFQDSSPSGATRHYVVFNRPMAVPETHYSAVTRRNLTATASDYLIVVPEEFMSAVEPLRALRESQGHRVRVAPAEAVYDEFNGGRRSAYAIRRFIRFAYRNWDARFVLLVGDASSDPKHYMAESAPDWVPTTTIAGPVAVFDDASSLLELIPADPWYVWCVDCPSPLTQPKIQDLFLGRLPVNSLQQTADVVAKLVAYESASAAQTWRRKMLLLADDEYSTTSFFGGPGGGGPTYCRRFGEDSFLGINSIIRSLILNEAGLVDTEPELFDLGAYLAGQPPDPTDSECRESLTGTQQYTRFNVTPELLSRLGEGRLWWNYQGHANPSVISHEDLYVNRGTFDDKDMLTNDGRPFLFSAFSCHPNFFSRVNEADGGVGPSFGEDMVVLPSRGAIASWGSSGFEIIPSNEVNHLNVHFARALFAHPPRDTVLGRWDGRVVLGEAVAKACIDNLGLNGNRPTPPSYEREVGLTYQLLGDPASRISIGAATMAVRANGQSVTNGEPVRLATSSDTVRIEADIASNATITSIALERTDGSGTQVVPDTEYTLTPAFPDTGRTGTAGRRYRLSYLTRLDVGNYKYTIRTEDAHGVPGVFDVVFRFFAVIRADQAPILDGDPVRADAELGLFVASPRPIVDPLAEFRLFLDGNPISFTPLPQEPTGRDWILSLPAATYAPGVHTLRLEVTGGFEILRTFSVEARTLLQNAFAFPNPFDDDAGTYFSFFLTTSGPANVRMRVYTVGGKLVHDRTERSLAQGYHQIHWDGRDAEGETLANGIYLFRIAVQGPGGSTVHEGRLVKLRRPIQKELDAEDSGG